MVELPSGGKLTVPAGALAEATTIVADNARVPAELADLSRDELLYFVHLGPPGLVFEAPVRIAIPAPRDKSGTRIVGEELLAVSVEEGGDALDNDEGDLQAQILPTKETVDGHFEMELQHFSAVAVIRRPTGIGQPLKAVKMGRALATASTIGLSEQLLQVVRSDQTPTDARITLTKIPEGRMIRANGDPFLLVSPAVATALSGAAAMSTGPILVNTSWRSIATQYVIANNRTTGDFSAARVGTSLHGVGAAVDLQPARPDPKTCPPDECVDVKTTCLHYAKECKNDTGCISKRMYPQTAAALLANGLSFAPFCPADKPCCDPVHWELMTDPNRQVRENAVRGFLRLWKASNPCASAESPGIPMSAEALRRLGESFSGGFDPKYVSTSFPVPKDGVQGLGCAMGNAVTNPMTGPPAASLCCPKDATHEDSWCAESSCAGAVCLDVLTMTMRPTDLSSDRFNCGRCGRECESCTNGQCSCSGGDVLCPMGGRVVMGRVFTLFECKPSGSVCCNFAQQKDYCSSQFQSEFTHTYFACPAGTLCAIDKQLDVDGGGGPACCPDATCVSTCADLNLDCPTKPWIGGATVCEASPMQLGNL